MLREIVNVDGEKVAYQDWLKNPVFKYLWSPLGAHVEALIYIKQGMAVPREIYETEGFDESYTFEDPTGSIMSWNSLTQERRDDTKESAFNGILTVIASEYKHDLKTDLNWTSLNPEGNTALDAKRELMRVAVAARLNQPDPDFQGA